eukprot:TRINITY_DN6332_c0_g1_i1.p1 TRINITY_DN6332_c0_g1~~TRINITY_DN6332_c0_g1_i1.p1  ORF type:complete len:547 (+),score=103.16 TRINITY_DN6332_c0_g1_i1:132-1772(+)
MSHENASATMDVAPDVARLSLVTSAEQAFGHEPEQLLQGMLGIARARFEQRDGRLDAFHQALRQELPSNARRDICFADLPASVLDRVLVFLSNEPRAITRTAQVCRSWRNVATRSAVWSRCCRIRWSISSEPEQLSIKLMEIIGQHAFRPSLQDVAPLVLGGADLEYRHGNIRATPMLMAAFHGHIHVVDYLLRNGAKRTETIACGKNAMMVACLQDKQEMVAHLLKQGFSQRDRDACGYTPFMLACLGGAATVVPYLKAQGSRIRDTSNNGNSALHCAAMGGHVNIVQLLVHWQLDVDLQDQSGKTPALVAARYGRGQAFCTLVRNGAVKTATDHYGANAVMQAALGDSCCAAPNLHGLAAHKNLLDCLLSKPEYDVNATDDHGRTALHYAVLMQHDILKQALLDHNADPNVRDNFGARPEDYLQLYRALRNNQPDRAATLLNRLTGVAMTHTSKHPFTNQEFRALCRALRGNRTIKTIILDSTVDAQACQEDWRALFSENRTLSELRLGYRECNRLSLREQEYLRANMRQQALGGRCFGDEAPL